jgi:hypothetical protein
MKQRIILNYGNRLCKAYQLTCSLSLQHYRGVICGLAADETLSLFGFGADSFIGNFRHWYRHYDITDQENLTVGKQV